MPLKPLWLQHLIEVFYKLRQRAEMIQRTEMIRVSLIEQQFFPTEIYGHCQSPTCTSMPTLCRHGHSNTPVSIIIAVWGRLCKPGEEHVYMYIMKSLALL